ncbi:MAG TPA: LacI family DNA-binding transcriptional regulator [Steroidobacteraceae bacterium]|jgi:LacI family transcriptional regulator|nr:LacI family DNA-binding transcriptional regulator [Steroidobacteraceae bacterium]
MSRKTITDVAAAAGVAIKTVSRVLNNEPKVRESTRSRVMAAVKALNYHPSISARGLAGRRSCLIGLVYENPSPNYVIDVQNGAMARCREERFQLIMHHCSVRGSDLAADIGGLVDQTHLDGLVLTPPLSSSRELIEALDERSLPFVRIAPNRMRHASPLVDVDDLSAAREMTEYLIGLGHRRIGFIIGNPEHYASGRRLEGYKAGLKRHGIAYRDDYVKQGYFVFESGLESGHELLTMAEPPTAIFASNDDMAAGVLMAAHQRGVSIPGQLSVAGFDDAQIARVVWPRLTTVFQPAYELAYSATDMLLQLLKSPKLNKSVEFDYRLVCRASTGPLAR